MTKVIITLMISFLFASCSTNTTKTHRFVNLGISESEFLEKVDNVSDPVKIPTSSELLENYSVYSAVTKYPRSISYLYVFQNDKLVYFNQANRLAIHDNEVYRAAAREYTKTIETIE